MKITNTASLPEPLVQAITNDNHTPSGADISVSALLKPPRMVVLERLHRDEIEEDASDRIWALMGQLGHAVLERAGNKEHVEHALIGEWCGWRVSGRIDLLKDKISDYKFVSVWSCADGLKPEWSAQMALYACLCWQNGIEVKGAEIVAIYRDWSKLAAKRDPSSYPQSQVQVFEVSLPQPEEAVALMEGLVQAHQEARTKLPECTAEERWMKPEKWAVMVKDRKSALRVFDTISEALHLCHETHGSSVKHRPGEWVRCANYCAAAPFCSQWQEHLSKELPHDN